MNLLIAISFLVSLAIGIPIAFVMGIGISSRVCTSSLHFTSFHSDCYRDGFFPIVKHFLFWAGFVECCKITDRIVDFQNPGGRIFGGLGHVNIVGV
jgi:hypothetical protein